MTAIKQKAIHRNGGASSLPTHSPNGNHGGVVGVKTMLKQLSNADTDALGSYPYDDAGNADCIKKLYGDTILYTSSHGWLTYAETHWTYGAEAEAKVYRIVEDVMRQRFVVAATLTAQGQSVKAKPCDAKNISGCMTALRYKTTTSIGTFDNDPDLLNCINGVVDLRTGKITKHEPRQRFTYCLETPYEPDNQNTEFVDWLKDTCPGEGMMDYLQRAVGYSLTGHTSAERLFYVYGLPGSGKGTFQNAMLKLMGSLAKPAPFSMFTAKRDGDNQNFDLAGFAGVRFVSASESNKGQKLNEAHCKTATGGDPIRAAFKHKDPFEFTPSWKIWLFSNNPVNADADDDGVWSRTSVIHFPKGHNRQNGEADPLVKERMQHPEVLAGLLKWAVDGAKLWYQDKRLIPPQAVTTETKKHRELNDFVQQWLDECCDSKPREDGTHTGKESARQSYERWCKGNGVDPLMAKTFNNALRSKGFDPDKRISGGQRVIGGLAYPNNLEATAE